MNISEDQDSVCSVFITPSTWLQKKGRGKCLSRRGEIYENAWCCPSKEWSWCGQGKPGRGPPWGFRLFSAGLATPHSTWTQHGVASRAGAAASSCGAAQRGRLRPCHGAGLSQGQPGQELWVVFQLLPFLGKRSAQLKKLQ